LRASSGGNADETVGDTGFLSVHQLAERYRAKLLSPVYVVKRALDRVEQLEPKLNAVSHIMAESAMRDAKRLTADLRNGRDLGLLHGIPIAIEDLRGRRQPDRLR
jgi:Asp-tRNA(Asn)/Glu-tRNA(Gln) amidotransferase A subunit family amidase